MTQTPLGRTVMTIVSSLGGDDIGAGYGGKMSSEGQATSLILRLDAGARSGRRSAQVNQNRNQRPQNTIL